MRKSIKRAISGILAGTMVLTSCVISNFTAFAAADTTLAAGSVSGKAGETVEVSIDLSGTKANNSTFWVEYDSSVAKATYVELLAEDGTLVDKTEDVIFNITSDNLVNGDDVFYNKYPDYIGSTDKTNADAGVLKLAYDLDNNAEVDGTVAKISFTISDTAKAGDSTAITLTEVDTRTAPLGDNTDLTVEPVNGSITVVDETSAATTFSAAKVEGKAGEEVTVDVKVSGEPAINNATYWLSYDSAVAKATNVEILAKDGVQYEDVTGDVIYTITEDNVTGDYGKIDAEKYGSHVGENTADVGILKLAFSLDYNSEISNDTVIAKVTFTIAADAKAGDSTDVTLENIETRTAPNGDNIEIDPIMENGSITVTEGGSASVYTSTLTADKVTAKAGETVDVEIKLDGTPASNSTFWVEYDPSVAIATKVMLLERDKTMGEETGSVIYEITKDNLDNGDEVKYAPYVDSGKTTADVGILKLAFGLDANEVITGTVAVITFEVASDAKEGTYPITLEDIDTRTAPNADNAKIDVTEVAGSITIGEPTPEGTKLEADKAVAAAKTETVTVNITLKDIVGAVNNGTFWITYDPAYIEVTEGKVLGSGGTLSEDLLLTIEDANVNHVDATVGSGSTILGAEDDIYTTDDIGKTNYAVGKIKAAFALDSVLGASGVESNVITADTVVATLTFKFNDAAQADTEYPVTLKVVEDHFFNSPVATGDLFVPVAVVNGSVKYTETVTEGSTETSTEAPTQATTETPTQATTEAPTQATTEAPTQAPTQATTEAPTQATTEAPAQVTTQAPAEESSVETTPAYVRHSSGGSSGTSHYAVSTTQATTEAASQAVTEESVENTTEARAQLDISTPANGYHFAYIAGYPDGTFGPTRQISRAEVAAIFARLIEADGNMQVSGTANYPDVDNSKWYGGYIGYITDKGVMTGDTSGTFRPDNSITRAEFAVVLSKFAGKKNVEGVEFSDVSGHWAESAIMQAAAYGWLAGSDGKFRPNDYITRAEAVTAINAATGRTPDKAYINANDVNTFSDLASTAWYYYNAIEATNAHYYTEGEVWYADEDAYNAALAK